MSAVRQSRKPPRAFTYSARLLFVAVHVGGVGSGRSRTFAPWPHPKRPDRQNA
jgi:hypothetical protein